MVGCDKDPLSASIKRRCLLPLGGVLGLVQYCADEFLQGAGSAGETDGLGPEAIQELIDARLAARKGKDWATADRIRDELKEQGILLEDGPAGCTWRRA